MRQPRPSTGAPAPLGTTTNPDDDGLTPAAPPRYDLPPGSRRLLTRVGPLIPGTGGLAETAFGNRGGRWLSILMRNIRGPVGSRWGHMLLRRTMLSAANTPPDVNGSDFTAARALLLLRTGEATGGRLLIQSIDTSRATPALRSAAMQTFLANADPSGMCPHVPAMVYGRDHDKVWELAQAMCAALDAESGTASALIERARRRSIAPSIDIVLAEKVVGAGMDGRRAAQVQWDGVTRMTPWRFGLASATGLTIPDNLWATATPAIRHWAVQSPMIPITQRMRFVPGAAAQGVISSRAYVDLLSYAAEAEGAPAEIEDQARSLRSAFVAANGADRVQAMAQLAGATGEAATYDYAGLVLVARAAARIRPSDRSDAESRLLIAAMLAGGLDRNAMAWAPHVSVGAPGWGLLAVGSPNPLVGVDADDVDEFADNDGSANQLRSHFLTAALLGLGRIDRAQAGELQQNLGLDLAKQTRWTRAIDGAAARGEAATVALLAAVGLQGDWADVPAYHLYHITAALRRVGLEADARMIAAEALTRV